MAEYVTIAVASTQAGVTADQINRWIDSGNLGCWQTASGQVLVNLDSVQQLSPRYRRIVRPADILVLLAGIVAFLVTARTLKTATGLSSTASAFALLITFIIVGVLTYGLWRYITPNGTPQRNEFAALILQILGGTFLLAGLVFTWQALSIDREQLNLNREARIIEGLTRATNQVQANDVTTRIGGIYALELIAIDSIERESWDIYWSIIEILVAFIRENAPAHFQCIDQEGITTNPCSAYLAESDVQAALRVIRRRSRAFDHSMGQRDKTQGRLNLNQVNFRDANLDGVVLRNVFLRHSDLTRAFLRDSNLRDAILTDTRLDGAHLDGANLRDADLRRATFQGACLQEAVLDGTHLQGADLSEAQGISPNDLDDIAEIDHMTKLPPELLPCKAASEDIDVPQPTADTAQPPD